MSDLQKEGIKLHPWCPRLARNNALPSTFPDSYVPESKITTDVDTGPDSHTAQEVSSLRALTIPTELAKASRVPPTIKLIGPSCKALRSPHLKPPAASPVQPPALLLRPLCLLSPPSTS
ncbi:hypothetical protein H920_16800 [Fukomys damarensis]|uniref:Uncharacterized protein n=1 Tax=Fukomys damarensis TaxID=885580 RepID=A0A091CUL3_FUKDA|nr:hypothetical protein H920_16800 [Fukomys damarensis]